MPQLSDHPSDAEGDVAEEDVAKEDVAVPSTYVAVPSTSSQKPKKRRGRPPAPIPS